MTRNFMFLSSEEQAMYNLAKAVKSMCCFFITPSKPEQTNSCESSNMIDEAKYLASIETYRAIQDNKCSSLENRTLNNVFQLVSGNDDFRQLRQREANALLQGYEKSTALRFMKPDSSLNKLTDPELNEIIKQKFDKIAFATSVLFKCSIDFPYIDSYKEEFTPENLNLYSKAISILHMYHYSDSINENYRLNNAQKVKSRILEFMTSLCMEYNDLLNQSSNDATEVSQSDSSFFKMGVFALCCELANLPISDNDDGHTKYKIYTAVMNELKQKVDSFPHMQPILIKIDRLIRGSRNVFSSSQTAPDLSALYKEIIDLDLKNNIA
jgi:hypothetical protein